MASSFYLRWYFVFSGSRLDSIFVHMEIFGLYMDCMIPRRQGSFALRLGLLPLYVESFAQFRLAAWLAIVAGSLLLELDGPDFMSSHGPASIQVVLHRGAKAV